MAKPRDAISSPRPDGSCANLPGAVHVAHRCRGTNCGRSLGLDEITYDDTLGWVHVSCTSGQDHFAEDAGH